MRRLARRLPFILVLLAVVLTAHWLHATRERMIPVAPGVLLSWGGRDWDIVDGRKEPYVGFDDPPLGGSVAVERVIALAKHANHLVGKSQGGSYFIMALRPLGRDEDPRATVTIFHSEAEWRAALSALNLQPPALRDPATVADEH